MCIGTDRFIDEVLRVTARVLRIADLALHTGQIRGIVEAPASSPELPLPFWCALLNEFIAGVEVGICDRRELWRWRVTVALIAKEWRR